MITSFNAIEEKLYKSRLADKGIPLCGASEKGFLWNKNDRASEILEKVFEHAGISAVIFSQPSEPYKTIITYLAETSRGKILPQDSETRHFLFDLPVLSDFTADTVIPVLKNRKSVIFPYGILACGVSFEQAFVIFSSVCFACFVKFFSDFRYDSKRGRVTYEQKQAFEQAVSHLEPIPQFKGSLMKAPFDSEEKIHAAVQEAGRLTVENRLVNSCFGNISYYNGNILYISRTGSFLDNLKGDIIPCTLDDIPCENASSELPAHRGIVRRTGDKAVLHGHPMFSVILSMDCDIEDCRHRGECHIKCSQERDACRIPIVPGEVGGGRYGLCHTVPAAVKDKKGVIVFGHGVFATGKRDFNEPFNNILEIEKECFREYFKRISNHP